MDEEQIKEDQQHRDVGCMQYYMLCKVTEGLRQQAFLSPLGKLYKMSGRDECSGNGHDFIAALNCSRVNHLYLTIAMYKTPNRCAFNVPSSSTCIRSLGTFITGEKCGTLVNPCSKVLIPILSLYCL